MNLRSKLNEYKISTLDLIKAIEEDSDGMAYINKREELLKAIGEMSFNKEELKSLYDELEIEKIDKKAIDVLSNEKSKVKSEMQLLRQKRNAANSYNNFKNVNLFNSRA